MFKRFTMFALVAALGVSAAVTTVGAADSTDLKAAKKAAKAAAKAAAQETAVLPPGKKTDAKVDLPKPDADGYVDLFNGKDLINWEGLADYWSVKDGVIVGKETKETSQQTFLIFKGMDVTDFELHLKFKFATPEGNSGIQFRSKVIEDATCRAGGYQADFDADNTHTGIFYDEAGVAGKRGIMSNRGEKTTYNAEGKRSNEKLGKSDAEIKQAIKVGDWNDVVLKVQGNHAMYQINGVTTTEMTDDAPSALKKGILALQMHKGFTMEIQFKDIKLKAAEAK